MRNPEEEKPKSIGGGGGGPLSIKPTPTYPDPLKTE
jgi:hypothetical protein